MLAEAVPDAPDDVVFAECMSQPSENIGNLVRFDCSKFCRFCNACSDFSGDFHKANSAHEPQAAPVGGQTICQAISWNPLAFHWLLDTVLADVMIPVSNR